MGTRGNAMGGKESEGTTDEASALQSADFPNALAAVSSTVQPATRSGGAFHCLIGLQDKQGRLVWVNRSDRSADLPSRSAALGRDLHGWLHPACMLIQCPLATALAECWAAVLSHKFCEAQLRDILADRILHLSAWRMDPLRIAPTPVLGGLAVVVVVITDVTALQVTDQTRRTSDRELEVRMLRHTDALARENENLQSELACCQASEERERASRAQFAEAARHLMSMQEIERIWVARQLRESVIQTLSAVKYRLEARDGSTKTAVTQLQSAMGDIDAIATSVRPAVLDDFGTVSAVRWLCREFSRSHPMLQVRENISVREDVIPQRLKAAVFRSVQELLSHVATRSQATDVSVCLSHISGQLVLEVLDDGIESRSACGDRSPQLSQQLFMAQIHAQSSGGLFSSGADGSAAGMRTHIEWSLSAENDGQTVTF